MRTLVTGFSLAGLAVLALVATSTDARACGGKMTAAKGAVKKVSVAELQGLLGTPGKPAVIDVNSAKTRAKMGVIPGAILLSSSSQYQAEQELPADKATPLVFYCANTHCKASSGAAERAVQAGYHDVAILPEGIAGWREAGFSTDAPTT